jgi:hypothetical protein
MNILIILFLAIISIIYSIVYFTQKTKKLYFFCLVSICFVIFAYALNVYVHLLESGIYNNNLNLSWWGMILSLCTPILSYYISDKK